MTLFNHSLFARSLDLKRTPARTYERCHKCDNGIDLNGCECRYCKGVGAVSRYHIAAKSADWQRPARPQL